MPQSGDELDRVLDAASRWASTDHGLALATVVEIGRSAPRVAGSHMLIRDDGLFEGSVSGGCVEGDVIVQAMELMAQGGGHRILIYQGGTASVWEVGLACGNGVTILIQTIDNTHFPKQLIDHLTEARKRREGVSIVTDFSNGRSSLRSGPPGDLFENIYPPPRRLALVGAVHIAKFLVPIAQSAGYEIKVIEPRQLFARSFDFQELVVEDWPDEALDRWVLDESSAVVALTHDPKLDDPALYSALASRAFYVGALGSRTTHSGRLKRMRGDGVDEAGLSRIHGPVGLDIGAVGPAEIAISIIAGITDAYRNSFKTSHEVIPFSRVAIRHI